MKTGILTLITFLLLSPNLFAGNLQEELAYKYAPIIYQATSPDDGTYDYITAVDFDGDLQGNNNWETAAEFLLYPIVYYAVVSTDTHHFITYSLFHPRDWAGWCTGLFYECHENDMENLQIVVEINSEEVVALVAQAHLWSSTYLSRESDESDGSILFLDEEGRESANGRVAVFVESGGHGIYGIDDNRSDVINIDGRIDFLNGSGVTYIPGIDQEISQPTDTNERGVPYHLESTKSKFWEPILLGELVGEGELFNGFFNYEDPMIWWEDVPRHFDSDMRSGIGKYNAGITPFAMGFSLIGDDVGGLFFNPVLHYRGALTIASNWSLNYTYHPYR